MHLPSEFSKPSIISASSHHPNIFPDYSGLWTCLASRSPLLSLLHTAARITYSKSDIVILPFKSFQWLSGTFLLSFKTLLMCVCLLNPPTYTPQHTQMTYVPATLNDWQFLARLLRLSWHRFLAPARPFSRTLSRARLTSRSSSNITSPETHSPTCPKLGCLLYFPPGIVNACLSVSMHWGLKGCWPRLVYLQMFDWVNICQRILREQAKKTILVFSPVPAVLVHLTCSGHRQAIKLLF